MASKATRTATSSASKLARKAEGKHTEYRTWLLSLIDGPTPGLPDNLAVALTQPATQRVAEHWLGVSDIDRDGPRNDGERPRRQFPPRHVLPPLC